MTASDGAAALLRRWLEAPGRFAWRWFTGKPLDGVPRSDATWLARGTAALDRETAPKLLQEIRSDHRPGHFYAYVS